ncbi:unnamed protein product [Pieris brassicae]|uniref:Uncharacterized protein n=1 Tax=Pieris brassicae TaxID=7116 RepID=A0A9P0XDA0_PIEBR|nr:unnamed protein product [Pieris brassicae]
MISGEYENIHRIIAVYYHFLDPGSLKPRLQYKVELSSLKDILDAINYKEWLLKGSRRWLPNGEAPFPGYCRAPGNEKCLPVLCNCEKLTEIWKKMKNKGGIKPKYT